MEKGHHAPNVGDAEGVLFLAARVALLVALLGVGVDQLARAHGGASHAAHEEHAAAPAHLELPALPPAPAASGESAIAAASPEASQAGLLMLRRGGNAFDAVVAASFAVCVTRPHATGIAGGGFAVVHLGASSTDLALDGRETAPACASRDMYRDAPGDSVTGPRSGGVPGFVALMYRLHRGQGKLPWADVLEPAILLARQGFPVDRGLAHAIAAHEQDLARWPSSAEVFLPGGIPLRTGDTLRQPDLARTLERIAAHGPDGFYAGETAALIAQGTPITPQDLQEYRVIERKPLVGTFRGRDIVTMPAPTSGGVVLLQVLRVLEGLDLAKARAAHDGAYGHLLAEALRHAHADRSAHLGDPFDNPDQDKVQKWLLSAARTDQIRAAIDAARARPLDEIAPSVPSLESDHTTHVSVMDDEGNAVSVTHTINLGLGSCYVIPGTGMLLNDEMDDFAARPGEPNAFGLVQGERNAIKPGKRPLSSMTPVIVIDSKRAVAAIGSPGGPKIISAVLQVFLNAFDAEMPLPDAVRAPRVHHQWQPDWLVVEGDLPVEAAEGLARRGHRVRRGESLGEVQAVFRVADRVCVAVSDPRGTGKPAALQRE